MSNEQEFKKSYDAVLFAASILKRLDGGNLLTFEQRLKSQKIYYFAQVFGIAPTYNFNLYLRGPYSPDLTYDLFKLKAKKIDVKSDEFVAEELERKFKSLKEFIKGKTIRQLEIIATWHWLIKRAQFSFVEAKKKIIEMKDAKEDEIIFASNCVKKLP
ncbi:MAG: hypothetical protein WC998_02350 [Candidatus Paceibacterota bacterium]|jgi:uncharacterized protein YwgA